MARDRDRVDGDAEDHRADVLRGGRLEEVRAAAGAIADVVADEIRDDAGVARVILRDTRLDLADEVRSDVRGLRVDAATELGEQGNERGAETEADDQERRVVRRLAAAEPAVRREDAPHAEERQRDDEEPGHRTTAHRDLNGLDERAAGRGGGSDVRANAD